MENNKLQSRKKFLGISITGITAAASFGGLRFFTPGKKEKKNTVKMLTQDGRLVEIDADKVYKGNNRKISDEQLKNFVHKKNKIPV